MAKIKEKNADAESEGLVSDLMVQICQILLPYNVTIAG